MANTNQSTTLLAAVPPILNAEEIITAAMQIITEKLNSLCKNANAQYWREVFHVIWGQLFCVHPIIEHLPPSFIIANDIITINCWMPSPAVVEQTKTWLDWDKIVNTPNTTLVDHAWYQLWFQDQGEQAATMDKGKDRAVDLATASLHLGQTTSHLAHTEQHGHSHSQKHRKSIKSALTINSDDALAAMMPGEELGVFGEARLGLLAVQLCHPEFDMHQVPPQPHLLSHPLLAHCARNVHQARASHPAHQEDQAVTHSDHAGNECYPIAKGLMGPMQHTRVQDHSSVLGLTPCCAISTAMVTMGFSRPVNLAPTTMVKEVFSYAGTPPNDMSESQAPLPLAPVISDALTPSDSNIMAEAPLVLTPPAIILLPMILLSIIHHKASDYVAGAPINSPTIQDGLPMMVTLN
ncbi:hypothetical protein J3A83DRAFT_4194307 [Scleroderma citrinum]